MRFGSAGFESDLVDPDPSTPRPSRHSLELVLGAAVTVASFVLYLMTTAHDQIAGDTPDFLLSAKTFGVPHAPGYPTLTVLGHLFSWLPLGTVAFRIDLLATCCGAATVALIYATALALTRRAWPSAGAAVALAATPLFWKWSLQIETFPLNNLLAAIVLYLLVRWHLAPERRSLLVGAAFTFALGMTNQQTIALLIPAIGLVMWLHRKELFAAPIVFAHGALAGALGLLPYLYVPLAASAHPPENWDNVNSLSSFVRMLTRKDYGGTTLHASIAGSGNFLLKFQFLFRGFGLVLGVLVLLGVLAAFTRLRWYLCVGAVSFVVAAIGTLLVIGGTPHHSTDLFVLERFFLLPMVIVAPFGAIGLAELADRAAQRWPSRNETTHRHAFGLVATAAVVTLSGVVVALNYSTLDVSHDHVTGDYARSALQELRPHTLLFVTGDASDLPILYANQVEHVRPDVTVVIMPLLLAPWYQQELRDAGQMVLPETIRMLNIVLANSSRPINFIGDPIDKSMAGSYYLYLNGLSFDLEPQATTISIAQAVNDNNAKFASYRVPKPTSIKAISFEQGILDQYALIFYTIGHDYDVGGDKTSAALWFRKGLVIDPHNDLLRHSLHKLGATF